eukprot:16993-Pleurochrysis_carterae.AAC.2
MLASPTLAKPLAKLQLQLGFGIINSESHLWCTEGATVLGTPFHYFYRRSRSSRRSSNEKGMNTNYRCQFGCIHGTSAQAPSQQSRAGGMTNALRSQTSLSDAMK